MPDDPEGAVREHDVVRGDGPGRRVELDPDPVVLLDAARADRAAGDREADAEAVQTDERVANGEPAGGGDADGVPLHERVGERRAAGVADDARLGEAARVDVIPRALCSGLGREPARRGGIGRVDREVAALPGADCAPADRAAADGQVLDGHAVGLDVDAALDDDRVPVRPAQVDGRRRDDDALLVEPGRDEHPVARLRLVDGGLDRGGDRDRAAARRGDCENGCDR